ncbi:MAG: tRNA-dihydrouridine synthase family protein [Lachnospiraceae bacterium]|nr:tRNA-dihydrouridine synthase family protein [Lachnospiraceae bacterium]
MKIYMAPMEGVTGFIFRNAYNRNFHGIDTYYTPFVTGMKLGQKEKNDVRPENNPDMNTVVQVLSNHTDDFLSVANIIHNEYGYDRINLNLGCPSATVSSRKRGSGFLSVPDDLDRFLGEIYEQSPIPISLKTRIGMHDASEWENILSIYEKYPVEELIIHPRIRDAFYGGLPNMEAFRYAYDNSRHTLCYNGDVRSLADYERIVADFPSVPSVMIGRGLIMNPFLPEEIKGISSNIPKRTRLINFEKDLQETYLMYNKSGAHHVLMKLKEVWNFYCYNFTEPDKVFKKIKKTATMDDYRSVLHEVFQMDIK